MNHQADGSLLLADIEAAIKPDDAHFARTRMLALENTWGGVVLPFEYVKQATQLAKAKGLTRHLDGARLFNAAVAQAADERGRMQFSLRPCGADEPPLGSRRAAEAKLAPSGGREPHEVGELEGVIHEARQIAQCFDSVSVCFSKGLGAPVGSALCGSREFIARAHRIRKMAGGGMRQAGVLAAAALYALDHNVARLADDHALARRLADGLAGIDGLQVEAPQTNIVFVDLVDNGGGAKARSAGLIPYLKSRGVLATGLYRLRFVTHLDVDGAGIDRAIEAIHDFFKR